MKALAIYPGKKNSMHVEEIEKPTVTDDTVLIKVLRVGVDGTDKELISAEYGDAPKGFDFLITGHESLGRIEEVGKNVTGFKKGDIVVPTVRRPLGHSKFDEIGWSDFTTESVYYERGINLLHGYLTEYIIEKPDFLTKIPDNLKEIAVLLEPTSIVEKGISQAYEIQKRMKVWEPKKAAIFGAGTIGLLAAMILRLKGLEVHSFARSKPPTINSDLLTEIGVKYHSLRMETIEDVVKKTGNFDIVIEATGYSPNVFVGMNILAKNGIEILTSVTGGDKKIEVASDKINLDFVLGNKTMFGTVNANIDHFKMGVKDYALAEQKFPGWLKKLLTHPVKGLENYSQMVDLLFNGENAIKVFIEIDSL